MARGGMQSQGTSNQPYCKCRKPTSKLWKYLGKEIAIHFTKKRTYWHIYENGKITKTYEQPEEMK